MINLSVAATVDEMQALLKEICLLVKSGDSDVIVVKCDDGNVIFMVTRSKDGEIIESRPFKNNHVVDTGGTHE